MSKAYRGRQRLHMLSDLASSAKYPKWKEQQKTVRYGELQIARKCHT